MPTLSICIPTFNRAYHLENLLESIYVNTLVNNNSIEICISDNNSSDCTSEVVNRYQKKLLIKYNRNKENIGATKNFLKVIEMSESEFVWLIGDDDLIMPNAIQELTDLINKNNDIDFFFVNSFHLDVKYLSNFTYPFQTINLPRNMKSVSNYNKSVRLNFLDLIDPKISFDFLGGIFLSIFRKELWLSKTLELNSDAINDQRIFSHFDNTFPHIKIFAKAFSTSNAFVVSEPKSVCVSGIREWASLNSFVQSIRLNEAVDVYRMNGLKFTKYIIAKNFSLRNFIPDLLIMLRNTKKSGIKYINIFTFILKNSIYPYLYLSLFFYLYKKINILIKTHINN